MLTQILIRDLVTIDSLLLSFQTGCTMITGETGAGKSIVIEAIEIGLGGRSSSQLIRAGKEKAEISLCFDITQFSKVIERLSEWELYQASNECIIRRVIMSDGRSRCYINGSPATLQMLKEMGELLFHMHGQHEQHILLKADTQREMLDRFGNHFKLTQHVKIIAEEYRKIKIHIEKLEQQRKESTMRSDYLRYQLEELKDIHLKKGEWEQLELEHKRLSHAEELIQQLQLIIEKLNNESSNSLFNSLYDIKKTLESLHAYEPQTSHWMTVLETSLFSLEALLEHIKNYVEKTEIDGERTYELEQTLSHLFNLSRKYRILPSEIPDYKLTIATELESLSNNDALLATLCEQLKLTEMSYQTACDTLSHARQQSALLLEKEVTQAIQGLGLPHGRFNIEFEKEKTNSFSVYGQEKIHFKIQTNPDLPTQLLAKAISGGELSRLSLAIHLALAHQTNIPTLIFDEVDTGLSGAPAEKIGKLLRKLGESYQVFCVTHQPQVAACGHHHLYVEKQFTQNLTLTQLKLLDRLGKIKEIARMLAGEKITDKTLAHASELLSFNEN